MCLVEDCCAITFLNLALKTAVTMTTLSDCIIRSLIAKSWNENDTEICICMCVCRSGPLHAAEALSVTRSSMLCSISGERQNFSKCHYSSVPILTPPLQSLRTLLLTDGKLSVRNTRRWEEKKLEREGRGGGWDCLYTSANCLDKMLIEPVLSFHSCRSPGIFWRWLLLLLFLLSLSTLYLLFMAPLSNSLSLLYSMQQSLFISLLLILCCLVYSMI